MAEVLGLSRPGSRQSKPCRGVDYPRDIIKACVLLAKIEELEEADAQVVDFELYERDLPDDETSNLAPVGPLRRVQSRSNNNNNNNNKKNNSSSK